MRFNKYLYLVLKMKVLRNVSTDPPVKSQHFAFRDNVSVDDILKKKILIFLGKKKKKKKGFGFIGDICMKCQILLSRTNKKIISPVCRLLNLPIAIKVIICTNIT